VETVDEPGDVCSSVVEDVGAALGEEEPGEVVFSEGVESFQEVLGISVRGISGGCQSFLSWVVPRMPQSSMRPGHQDASYSSRCAFTP
jgi:hypothetical protein